MRAVDLRGRGPVAEQDEKEEIEEPEDDEEVVEEDDSEVTSRLGLTDDDEDSDEASLEELLSQRAAARKPADVSEEEDDIMSLASERDTVTSEPITPGVTPIKDRHEFVCNNCRLVKKRSQLADADRALCRDCV